MKILKTILDLSPLVRRENEADIIRILGNIRSAIKITKTLLMSHLIFDEQKENL
jgi:hypothetical protein